MERAARQGWRYCSSIKKNSPHEYGWMNPLHLCRSWAIIRTRIEDVEMYPWSLNGCPRSVILSDHLVSPSPHWSINTKGFLLFDEKIYVPDTSIWNPHPESSCPPPILLRTSPEEDINPVATLEDNLYSNLDFSNNNKALAQAFSKLANGLLNTQQLSAPFWVCKPNPFNRSDTRKTQPFLTQCFLNFQDHPDVFLLDSTRVTLDWFV